MIAIVLEMSGIPSLAFAVGVYLPLSLVDARSSSAAWSAGWSTATSTQEARGRNLTEEQLTAEGDKSPGVLMASGYIAGGAIAGILIAFAGGLLDEFTARISAWAEASNPFFGGPNADLLSLLPFAGLCVILVPRRPRVAARAAQAGVTHGTSSCSPSARWRWRCGCPERRASTPRKGRRQA